MSILEIAYFLPLWPVFRSLLRQPLIKEGADIDFFTLWNKSTTFYLDLAIWNNKVLRVDANKGHRSIAIKSSSSKVLTPMKTVCIPNVCKRICVGWNVSLVQSHSTPLTQIIFFLHGSFSAEGKALKSNLILRKIIVLWSSQKKSLQVKSGHWSWKSGQVGSQISKIGSSRVKSQVGSGQVC